MEGARARNQRPDIDGEIIEAFIGPVSYSPESEQGSVVLLSVKAWNKVQMPDVTAGRYELSVKLNADSAAQLFTGMQEGWRVQRFDGGGAIRDIDISREALRAIRYISSYSVPDHVGFYVNGMPPTTKSASSIELTVIDLLGGRHCTQR